ncbi:MAG TPA: 1-deoxy-D-xylulose-5-phosphate reductoisomerase [Thermoanaerobaculia bacterium]|nr:1-deoxy-D-xylulose-5-phosphate reductoisomerase [Thermoanaerobaculia bacterium]
MSGRLLSPRGVEPRAVSVLGSTGSIGRAALDVIGSFPDRFRVAALAAGRSLDRLVPQIERHAPLLVSVEREEDVARLESRLPSGFRGRIVAGPAGLEEAATLPEADVVLAGLVGAVGLRSAHAALAAGKRLALANKEALVVAGQLMVETARANGGEIVPVDSEHSAVHQAIRCGQPGEVDRIVLTGSGGPLRERDLSTFSTITVEEALAHPTWKMGPKISIDSATMMNKGLEVIEAHFLFGVAPAKIDVVLHPQSVIHSFVEFVDGSLVAQMARNDMRFPILYALSYPERLPNPFGRLDLVALGRLEFEQVDPERYPALALARAALEAGGGTPGVVNAANEVAVEAFLEGKISFPDIVAVVSETALAHGRVPAPATVEEAEQIDREARQSASRILRTLARAS